ncbi:MAG: elongation factor Ts [Patescibacteria group bacterium]
MITIDTIKSLRDQTGVSVIQCKKALEETGGDMGKALMVLRKKSADIAAKKADRTLGAGTVAAYVHANKAVGALVELSCETDFVAKNEDFQKLAYDIAMHVAATNPEFISESEITEDVRRKTEELFTKEVEASGKAGEIKKKMMEGKLAAYFGERILVRQPFIKNPDVTVGTLVDQAIQKFGEKTEVARISRFAI